MCVCVCVRLTVRTPGLLDGYTDPQTDALDTDTRDFHVHVYTYSLSHGQRTRSYYVHTHTQNDLWTHTLTHGEAHLVASVHPD